MASYDHLPLTRLKGEFERRRHGFGSAPERNHQAHGARIQEEISKTIASFSELPAVEGIDPSLILKVTVESPIDEDEWRKLQMTVLSVDGDQSVVLFANDKSLQEFKRKVTSYQGEIPKDQAGPQYAGLVAAVDSVSLIQPVDRIGRVLNARGYTTPEAFDANDTYTLDFELHRPANQLDIDLSLFRLEKTLTLSGGIVLSSYSGSHMLIMRATGNGNAVRAALALPEVSVVDIPPQPDLAQADLLTIDAGDLPEVTDPPDGAVVIGIIDTGVNFGHPLLAKTEAGAITAVPAWGTSDTFGHGTSVASIAAFGDIAARVAAKNFNAQFRLASARVTSDIGKFPTDISLPDLMQRSIRTLHADHQCRIFNISLGDSRGTYAGGKPDPWTATLDYLARELDVLIIVSSGNRDDLAGAFGDGVVAAYPQFFSNAASRINEPATGANIVAVGAIAHSNGLEHEDEEYAGVRPIAMRDEPSPFTRIGPGIGGMIKPEFVDIGGNAVWDGPSGKLLGGNSKASAGIWTFYHAPIGNSLFTSRSGTSFAAPNLAYKAALLLSRFPDASANLLRALLSISSRIPNASRDRLHALADTEIPMVCGHGLVNAEHAANSDDGRVVFYAEDELPLGQFAIFEVPIPKEFQTLKGDREIRVSLAFDPPVRHTRAAYLGVTMAWRLLRGSSHADVLDRFRKWKKDEGKPPEFAGKNVCWSDIKSTMREYGTLQTGTFLAKRDLSEYGDKYYVAVWALRRWAPDDVRSQKYALCVQLRHQNMTTLYQTLTTPIIVQV